MIYVQVRALCPFEEHPLAGPDGLVDLERHIRDVGPQHVGHGPVGVQDRLGIEGLGQVDLERRVHRNQDTRALGRMSFVVLKTFLKRLERLGLVEFRKEPYDQMLQYRLVGERLAPEVFEIQGLERPPMVEIPEYRAKMGIA